MEATITEIPKDERAVSDLDFFNALDPKRQDLAKASRVRNSGDLEAAKRFLIDHFRTRQYSPPEDLFSPLAWFIPVCFAGHCGTSEFPIRIVDWTLFIKAIKSCREIL